VGTIGSVWQESTCENRCDLAAPLYENVVAAGNTKFMLNDIWQTFHRGIQHQNQYQLQPAKPALPIVINYPLNKQWAPLAVYGKRAALRRKLWAQHKVTPKAKL